MRGVSGGFWEAAGVLGPAVSLEVVLVLAGLLGGGGALRWLLRLLIRVLIWHLIFHVVGGFMGRYTHLPPWVNVILLVVVIVAVRFAVTHLRRRT